MAASSALYRCAVGLFITLMFCGCSHQRLWVQSHYIGYSDLASYRVQTPDPRKECPDIGQRLLVYWALPADCFEGRTVDLLLHLRYGCREQETLRFPVLRARGNQCFSLVNSDYRERGGILTYKAEIYADGELIDCWRHQIWTDIILIGEEALCP